MLLDKGKGVPLHTMKVPGGRGGLILNLSTRWGWVVSITPRLRFAPWERTPGTNWTGGRVDPRAGLDAEAGRKILYLCQGLNPGRPVRSQTLYWLRYMLLDTLYKITKTWDKVKLMTVHKLRIRTFTDNEKHECLSSDMKTTSIP
jgi:hypothetical protein